MLRTHRIFTIIIIEKETENMRIITGTARGMKLETLDGDEVTRPTSEKVKEAVFSAIQFDIEGRRVLDVFGGSGQMALEALSRGADFAVIGDADKRATEVIKRNAQKTKLFEKTRILTTDFRSLIKGLAGRERFDIVFLDPPYEGTMVEESLSLIMRSDILNPNAYVICESDKKIPFECEGLGLKRFYKYGRVFVTILVKENEI